MHVLTYLLTSCPSNPHFRPAQSLKGVAGDIIILEEVTRFQHRRRLPAHMHRCGSGW